MPATLEHLDALRSPVGERLLSRIAAEPGGGLRLAERLRAEHPAALVAAALTLAGLRDSAARKFRLASRMWFTREGLEQASSDALAAHHADRLRGLGRLADLCTGIGGDLTALATGREVLAVDLDPLHACMAGLNAEVHGHERARTLRADVTTVPLDGFEAVFVDPARRLHGRRLRPGSGLPPLAWCLGLVRPGWEVEFVSAGGELKEALLWSPALASAPRRATLLDVGAALVPQPGEPVPCAAPGGYLYDPDPAVTRAGLVEELATALGAHKIDERIAFLSADRPLATPFARLYAVDAVLPFSLKTLRAHLRARSIGVIDVRKRGSAVDVDDLRRRLRLQGDGYATVVLTRVADRPTALVCVPAPT